MAKRRTDAELAEEIRRGITNLARLMTEAKKHNIVVNFQINEIDLTINDGEKRKEFAPAVTIQKIETL